MKALMRLSGRIGDMDVVQTAEPVLQQDDWVHMQVHYAGVCGGSDLKLMQMDADAPGAKLKPPVILGHEFSGIVTQVGPLVTHIQPGDRVTVDTIVSPCGHCSYCMSGDWNMCPSRLGVGSSFPGGFAEYFAGPARNFHILPEGLPLHIGALTEPTACAVHIVYDVAKVRAGERVVIVGPGVIGLLCAAAALFAGARVLVVGTPNGARRLELARRLGCQTLVNDTADLAGHIKALWGELADVAIDAVGTNQALQTGLHTLRKMGRVVAGGVPFKDKTPYQIDMDFVYRNQISIGAGRSSRPSDWPLAMQILQRYAEQIDAWIDDRFSLAQWRQAFEQTRNKQVVKAMFACIDKKGE